jgi:GTPase involved in cell partitioning and DNA repair
LELYKEDLPCKPAVLVVNKMDLPDAEDKLAELQEQLLNPHGNLMIYVDSKFR